MAKKQIKKKTISKGSKKRVKKSNLKRKPKKGLIFQNQAIRFDWTKPQVWASLLAILLLTTLAYLPSLDGGLTNWDDEEYITFNPTIQDLNSENISKMFSMDKNNFVQGNYHPLTMLSLALNYEPEINPETNQPVVGARGFPVPNPYPFHLWNLILHVLNSLFVFLLVYQITRKKWLVGLIVAILFAIHPMHVESVAWATERKDVLYAFFFLPALIAYLRYVRTQNYVFLALSFLMFLASILSKPAAVVLPVILFLLDYLERRSTKDIVKILLEKVPFFALSIYLGIETVEGQSDEAIDSFDRFSLFEHTMHASYSFMGYICKLFYPFPLKIFYPFPSFSNPPLEAQLSPLFALIFVGLAIYSIKYTRVILFGVLFYAITVALVLQFVSVGGAIMAERYTYIPYLGLFFILAMGIYYLLNRSKGNKTLGYVTLGILGAACLLFTYQTYERSKVWKNEATLYTSILAEHPNLNGMRLNRGNYYLDQRDYENAMKDYGRVIKTKPRLPGDYREIADAYHNIAIINAGEQKFQDAVDNLTKAINIINAAPKSGRGNIKNDRAIYHYARGNGYKGLGKGQEAINDYNQAIKDNPNFERAYLDRGIIYYTNKRYAEALADFSKAIQVNPRSDNAYNNRGSVYLAQKKYQQAMQDLQRSQQLNPNNPNVYFNYAIYYQAQGDKPKALQNALKAKQLGGRIPDDFINSLR